MSAPRQEVTTTSTDSVPQPIQSETPTMRLGSMLQALRDKTRQEQLNPREPVSDGRAGFDARFDGDDSEQRTLSPKELHAFERIPKRWQPIAVCIAGLAVLIVGAATRPSVRALLARQTTVSTPSRPQAGEPAHLAAVNAACPCAASSACRADACRGHACRANIRRAHACHARPRGHASFRTASPTDPAHPDQSIRRLSDNPDAKTIAAP